MYSYFDSYPTFLNNFQNRNRHINAVAGLLMIISLRSKNKPIRSVKKPL